jgi:hypothetical protein
MSKPMIEGSNIVPLFKNFAELQRDEDEILKQYAAEWERAYVIYDMTEAALNNDATALAKFAASPEMALAKSEAQRLRSRYAAPETFAMVTLVKSLKAAVEKRNDRLYGHTALAKRSMRFAMAHDRRNYGTAANSLPPLN